VNAETGHVNLVGARDLGGNTDVMKAPAVAGNRGGRFVVLSQMLMQSGISFGAELAGLYARAAEAR